LHALTAAILTTTATILIATILNDLAVGGIAGQDPRLSQRTQQQLPQGVQRQQHCASLSSTAQQQ